MKLYELAEEFSDISAMLYADEEIDQQTIDDTLEAAQIDFDTKVENIVKLIRNMEADANGYKAESERLAKRKGTVDGKIQSLKEYIKGCYERAGITRAGTAIAGARLQNNPPSVEIADERVLPDEYLIKQEPKVDKKALIAALKEGAEIPGACLRQTKSIRLV